jgi:hypothetical protein
MKMEVIMNARLILVGALALLPISDTLSYLVSHEARLKAETDGIILGCTQGTAEQRKTFNSIMTDLTQRLENEDSSIGGRVGCPCDHSNFCTIDMFGSRHLDRTLANNAAKIDQKMRQTLFKALPDVEANIKEINVFSEFADNSIPLFVSELRGSSEALFAKERLKDIYRIMRPGSFAFFETLTNLGHLTETQNDFQVESLEMEHNLVRRLIICGFQIPKLQKALTKDALKDLYEIGAISKNLQQLIAVVTKAPAAKIKILAGLIKLKESSPMEWINITLDKLAKTGMPVVPGLVVVYKPQDTNEA